jgi:hypothetical protein
MATTQPIIEPCEGYRVGDGLYPILVDAQKAALSRVTGLEASNSALGDIVANREEVIKILSLKEPKQRKPRADKGTHRTRKSFAVHSATATGKP